MGPWVDSWGTGHELTPPELVQKAHQPAQITEPFPVQRNLLGIASQFPNEVIETPRLIRRLRIQSAKKGGIGTPGMVQEITP